MRRWLLYDEKSMMGQELLGKTSARLGEAHPRCSDEDDPLHGFNVVLSGDYGQLPPVKDTAIYLDTPARPGKNAKYSHQGKLAQASFKDNVIVLEGSKRHVGEDKLFLDALLGVRKGHLTDAQYKLFETRFVSNVTVEERKSFNSIHTDHFYGTNKEREVWNKQAMAMIEAPFLVAKATHPCLHPDIAKKVPTLDAGNLHVILEVKVGCSVMLKSNLWTDAGLVNGAKGIIEHIISPDANSNVVVILVHFPSYTGDASFPRDDGVLTDKLIPIVRKTAEFQQHGKNLKRNQFPLTVSHGITAHSSQGMTVYPPRLAYIALPKLETSRGLSFVMTSRTKKLDQMLIEDFELNRINDMGKTPGMLKWLDFSHKQGEAYAALKEREQEDYDSFWKEWPAFEQWIVQRDARRKELELLAFEQDRVDVEEEAFLEENPPSKSLSTEASFPVLDANSRTLDLKQLIHLLDTVVWVPTDSGDFKVIGGWMLVARSPEVKKYCDSLYGGWMLFKSYSDSCEFCKTLYSEDIFDDKFDKLDKHWADIIRPTSIVLAKSNPRDLADVLQCSAAEVTKKAALFLSVWEKVIIVPAEGWNTHRHEGSRSYTYLFKEKQYADMGRFPLCTNARYGPTYDTITNAVLGLIEYLASCSADESVTLESLVYTLADQQDLVERPMEVDE